MAQEVVIVGAGVVGLSSAVRLAEDPARRFDVRVVAERIGRESLSRVAAATFHPYAVAHARMAEWLRRGLAEFRQLAEVGDSGVRLRPGRVVSTAPVCDPAPDLVIDPQPGVGPAEGLDPRFAYGWRSTVAVVEMPIYLDYLRQRAETAGARVERASVYALEDVAQAEVIVVNCTGVKARLLVHDLELTPTLGQVVRVAPRVEIDEFRVCDDDAERPTYVVPRSRDCVLGSIDRPWSVERRGFEPPDPDARVLLDILNRARELDARLEDAVILSSECGLRPRRREVRLEIDHERLGRGQRVVHNYGHGGAGVTLSWGCADEAVRLVQALVF